MKLMSSLLRFAFLYAALSLTSTELNAQKLVKIIHSDRLEFKKELTNAQRLIGNVRLQYENITLSCDSVWLFPNEDFRAYNNIRINQADSLQIFGDRLELTSKDKIAIIEGNVRLSDHDMTLTTKRLRYDIGKGIANYFGGGKIVSRANQNVLTSNKGSYDTHSGMFSFRGNVELKNPEYRVVSDTLKYNNFSGRSFFFGPTNIFSAGSRIYCENGWYDSATETCRFGKNAEIHSKNTRLKGDSILYNGIDGIGEAIGNVDVLDTLNRLSIFGNYGWTKEEDQHSYVTGNALMIQDFGKDSLFLHADTLRALPDSAGMQRILAYRNVKFFKRDLQGRADSMAFVQRDSLIWFFGEPLLWSDRNQLSADTIRIRTFGGIIDRLYLHTDAFITSQAWPDRYNQIKGRQMTGWFRENILNSVHVSGNGQTIYFPEETSEKPPRMHNRVECSDIRISIENNKVVKISFENMPAGILSPMSLVGDEDMTLEGMRWEESLRPRHPDDVFQR
jgi:lipopolysaccharide export system protein LptA